MTRAAAIVVAILLAACGDEGPAPSVVRPAGRTPPGMTPAVTVIDIPASMTGPAAWTPADGDSKSDYVEGTSEAAEPFAVAWKVRSKGEPPRLDFAKQRVAWVAQHAKDGGHKGASLRRVEESVQGVIVEYMAVEPGLGRSYPPEDKGYVGFWVVVPRREGDVHFTRLVEHR